MFTYKGATDASVMVIQTALFFLNKFDCYLQKIAAAQNICAIASLATQKYITYDNKITLFSHSNGKKR
jgi:hypothetical protein